MPPGEPVPGRDAGAAPPSSCTDSTRTRRCPSCSVPASSWTREAPLCLIAFAVSSAATKYRLRSTAAGSVGGESSRGLDGTALRRASASSAAARPRSWSSGGAKPCESARSSSSVSWASPAPPRSPRLPRAVRAEPPLGRGQLHLQPEQPLLRPVVDVPLEPAEGVVLGGDGGQLRRLDLLDAHAEVLGPEAGEEQPPQAPVGGGQAPGHERERGDHAEPEGAEPGDEPGRPYRVEAPAGRGDRDLRGGPARDVHDSGAGQIEGGPGAVGADRAPDRRGGERDARGHPRQPDHGRHDGEDGVQDPAVQVVEPRVRVAEHVTERPEEALAAERRGPARCRDAGHPRPAQPAELEHPEVAGRDEQQGEDDEADEHRQQSGAEGLGAAEHREGGQTDDGGEGEVAELPRHPPPESAVADGGSGGRSEGGGRGGHGGGGHGSTVAACAARPHPAAMPLRPGDNPPAAQIQVGDHMWMCQNQ